MHKRRFLASLLGLAVAGLMSFPAYAQLVEGRDYVQLEQPQPTESRGKIEVVEFFSYGCIHCYHFEEPLRKWTAHLPPDVVFKRVPVSFGRPAWFTLNRLYYALEALGANARFDDVVFAAIHDRGMRLYDDATVIDFAATSGLDRKKFSDAYNSFGVMSKAKRADQLVAAYKIQGTPTLAVDGRYLATADNVGSPEELLGNAEKLIAKVRAERKK